MNSCLSRFHLQVLTHVISPVASVASVLIDVLDAGADTVQLRDDEGTSAHGLTLVEAISRELPGAVDRLIVHERLAGAGISPRVMTHLTSASAKAEVGSAAEDRITDSRPFGMSVHSLDEARWGTALGAAYLTFGHVFETPSHPGVPPRGVAALSRVVANTDAPVLAIGGITPDTLDDVLHTRCAGIVVRSAVLGQSDPAAATRRLRALLDNSPFQPCHRFVPPRMAQGGP